MVFSRNNLFLILLLFITFFTLKANVNCKERTTGYFKSTLNAQPFFYEHTFQSYNISFNGSLGGGIKINRFILGLAVHENYNSINGNISTNMLEGAWNVLGGTFTFGVFPVEWFFLETGLGGSWYQSAFNLNNTGIINITLGGITLLFNARFRIPAEHIFFKHFAIEQFNTFHLFIHNPSVQPSYSGGIRFHFKPWLQFLTLYIEVAGNTWFYNSELIDVKSGYVSWGVGVSLDLEFPFDKRQVAVMYQKKIDDDIIDVTEDTNDIKIIIPHNNRIARLSPRLVPEREPVHSLVAEFLNAKKDEIIRINRFYFTSQNEIPPNTKPLVTLLRQFLTINSSVVIGIVTWSNEMDDPILEISISKERGLVIKRHLVKGGISGDRIKVLSSALLYDPAFDSYPYVEIKILKK